ncbi:hypothetical protein ST47_g7665 [Ascochyta rabiei]|uniref:Uncharacterized protein n=1 Tax=Didymella rabiei TaxID=5454 RepID=A0A163AJY6_DIDRA|nr:hypothetical protein ST47_g7665 [Ascochyta rabiei]
MKNTDSAFFTLVCYFFLLPRELRIHILRKLWSFTPLIRAQFNFMPIELYLRGSVRHSNAGPSIGLPLWLLTCKSFFIEGMQEFDLLYESTIGPHHARLSAHPHTARINPAARGTMTIWVGGLSTYGPRRACFTFSDTDIYAIEHILDHTVVDMSGGRFTVHRSHLNTLRIKAAFTNVCVYCQYWSRLMKEAEEWRLDLSPLLGFRFDLDVFEFEITGVDTMAGEDGFWHLMNCWDQVEHAFEREVRSIGEQCTGDGNGNYSMTVSATSPKDVIFRFTKSRIL